MRQGEMIRKQTTKLPERLHSKNRKKQRDKKRNKIMRTYQCHNFDN
jgi:hypothetical protein